MCPNAKQLQTIASDVGDVLEAYSQSLLALVIDTHWSNTTLNLVLNEEDDIRRHKLIDTWRYHRLADLERINLIIGHRNKSPEL